MAETTPILTLAEIRLTLGRDGTMTAPLVLTVQPDELVLLDLGGPEQAAAFADAVCGLVEPHDGRVAFLGRDWRNEPPSKADALRGRIGRLHGTDPWLPWMTVAENLLLAPLYHTRLPRETLLARAAQLAHRFGLPGVPLGYPETLGASDLARAALVRAFLGPKRLVILEDPTALPGGDILASLLTEMRVVRDDGGAVLWLTHDSATVMDRTLPATQRWRMIGSRLVAIGTRAA